MAKVKKNVYPYPDVSTKNYILIKNGIKVYPINSNGKFKIEVENNGKITTFNKIIGQSEVNGAINKTISHYYQKLKENEKH